MDIIDVMTTHGHTTDITVQPVSILGGGMVIAVITDIRDGESIAVYDDEIDNLIAALLQAKEFMK